MRGLLTGLLIGLAVGFVAAWTLGAFGPSPRVAVLPFSQRASRTPTEERAPLQPPTEAEGEGEAARSVPTRAVAAAGQEEPSEATPTPSRRAATRTAAPSSVAAPTRVPDAAPTRPAPTAAPRRAATPTAPAAPSGSITITGIVADVAASARIISLQEPVEGIETIALTEDTEIVFDGGRPAGLSDVRPGMRVQASGGPGEHEALLAQRVVLFRGA